MSRTPLVFACALTLTSVLVGRAQAPPPEGFGFPCTSGRFPLVMAFRTSLGETIGADGISSGTVQADRDFGCVEIVLDKNTEFLREAESRYRDRVTTLWHLGWGTIGRNSLTPDRSALADDPAFTIFPGHWLFEVGTTATMSIDTRSVTKVYVADATNFSVGDDVMIHAYDPSSGEHDWSVEHEEREEREE